MKKCVTILFVFLVLFSCSKDNDNDNEQPDVSGFWIITENITGNCGGDDYTEQEIEIIEIEQSGINLIYTTYPEGKMLEGTIVGITITMEGEFSNGGTASIISFSGTINNTETIFNGNADWEEYSNDYNCSGTAVVSGEKAAENDEDYSGTWMGNWFSEEYGLNGSFTVNVNQTGHTLSGTISVPEISMSGAVLQGEVHGNVVYFGDINGIIKFAGTIDNNFSSGTYTYPVYGDEGTWTADRLTNNN